MFNIYRFKSAVSSKGFTLSQVAMWLGINKATLYRKMYGKSDFTRNEIYIISSQLHLNDEEIFSIFFDN
jgi:cyanate lyase